MVGSDESGGDTGVDRPVVACVLAGGTGTRLYPASRSDRPKQFLALDAASESLLARTVDRVSFADETVVLTGDRYADAVRDHAPDAMVVVEPAPKDTGPALAYAARRVREAVGECVLLCVPADHHVTGDFEAVARRAVRVAVETDGLVTMGVEPTRPATGYGYIEPGEWTSLAAGDGSGDDVAFAPVRAFREKPDRNTARQLLDLDCLWNAGIFAWTPSAFLRACVDTPLEPLSEGHADLAADSDADSTGEIDGGSGDDGDLDAAFEATPAVSVDYAVLERTDEAYVVPAAFEWDDLGSWNALGRILDADDAGNVVVTADPAPVEAGREPEPTEPVLVDTTNSVVATDDMHVSVVDTDGLVVAAFDDRVLVVPRESSQRVREVVDALRESDLF